MNLDRLSYDIVKMTYIGIIAKLAIALYFIMMVGQFSSITYVTIGAGKYAKQQYLEDWDLSSFGLTLMTIGCLHLSITTGGMVCTCLGGLDGIKLWLQLQMIMGIVNNSIIASAIIYLKLTSQALNQYLDQLNHILVDAMLINIISTCVYGLVCIAIVNHYKLYLSDQISNVVSVEQESDIDLVVN